MMHGDLYALSLYLKDALDWAHLVKDQLTREGLEARVGCALDLVEAELRIGREARQSISALPHECTIGEGRCEFCEAEHERKQLRDALSQLLTECQVNGDGPYPSTIRAAKVALGETP